jgi:hypothetical protein
LGERLNGIQEVASSILVSSTNNVAYAPLSFRSRAGERLARMRARPLA